AHLLVSSTHVDQSLVGCYHRKPGNVHQGQVAHASVGDSGHGTTPWPRLLIRRTAGSTWQERTATVAVDTISRAHGASEDSGATKLTTVDRDIHHGIRSSSDLMPYLSRVTADRYASYGAGGGGNLYAYNGGVRGYRADVVEHQSPGGLGAAATNIEM